VKASSWSEIRAGARHADIAPSSFDGGNEAARLALVEEREVVVSVTLGNGEGSSRMIGVDLSYDYVKINAEYST